MDTLRCHTSILHLVQLSLRNCDGVSQKLVHRWNIYLVQRIRVRVLALFSLVHACGSWISFVNGLLLILLVNILVHLIHEHLISDRTCIIIVVGHILEIHPT